VAEILEEYLTDQEEAYAECTFRFLKQNGEVQEKHCAGFVRILTGRFLAE
jgi:hypothetical protein